MKIRFYRDHLAGQINFLLYEKLPDGSKRIIKPVDLITEIVDKNSGYKILPTFSIDDFDMPELLKDLAEQLNTHGIRTDSDARLQGTLDSTKYHLEDMRKLVFGAKAPQEETK